MFHEPLIPPNTGNAIRIAAGTGARLHLGREEILADHVAAMARQISVC